MVRILPQQQLLLELLVMSGDIAVHNLAQNTILKRTMDECVENGWVTRNSVNSEFTSIAITPSGRSAVESTVGG